MATEILRPNAAGDETALFQYPASTYNWDKVDEVSHDGVATVVYAYEGANPPVYRRDLYKLPAHSVGSGKINQITVCWYYKTATGGIIGKSKASIKSGTTVADGAEKSSSLTEFVLASEVWTTDPATSVAWTWNAIDALQIGESLKSGVTGYACYCTQVWVEIDYTTQSIIPVMMAQYRQRWA